jgi:hypothetical protein
VALPAGRGSVFFVRFYVAYALTLECTPGLTLESS